MRPKLAVLGFAAVLAGSSGAGAADLWEQRLACQEEDRQHIRPSRADLDLYRRAVERRQLYVQHCMTNGLRDVQHTGSTLVPLPPKRPEARE